MQLKFSKNRKRENYMKLKRFGLKKIMAAVLVLCLSFSMYGCRGGDDTIPTLPPKKVPKQIAGAVLPEGGNWVYAEAEVIEDSNMVHEKDGQTYTRQPESFYVADYSTWKSSCTNSIYKIIRDRKSEYDEDFFDDKMVVCAVKTTSAGQQYQFEGAALVPENGMMVLTVYMSYDVSTTQNTLANYYAFLEVDKEGIEQIDKINVEAFVRTN